MKTTYWVLAVTPEDEQEPSMSIHQTYDEAIYWLRSGWDSDGDYADVDDDELLERLRNLGYGVGIEGLTPYWSSNQEEEVQAV